MGKLGDILNCQAFTVVRPNAVLTHDVTTITKYAYERINEGLPMPGVFEIKMNSPLGDIIEDILLVAVYSYENEWEGKILYLPLKDGT